jgi:hypothetical protein
MFVHSNTTRSVLVIRVCFSHCIVLGLANDLCTQGDCIGGDAYWAAGVSLIGNIPQKPHWPLKPHLYINAGKLGTLDRSGSSFCPMQVPADAHISTFVPRLVTVSRDKSVCICRDRSRVPIRPSEVGGKFWDAAGGA